MKQRLFFAYKAAFLLCMLFIFQTVAAQEPGDTLKHSYQTQLRFWLSPVIYNKLELEHKAEKILHTKPTLSAEIGVGFYQRVFKSTGINASFGVGIVPYYINAEYYVDLPGVMSDDPFGQEFYEYALGYYIASLSLQHIFKETKNFSYFIEPGIKINSFLNFPYYISNGASVQSIDTIHYDLFNFYLKNDYRKNFISYTLKAGAIKTTKKTNTLSLSIVAQYSPDKIGKGQYTFYNLRNESYGNTSLGINYLGIEFNYGLTLIRKHKR